MCVLLIYNVRIYVYKYAYMYVFIYFVAIINEIKDAMNWKIPRRKIWRGLEEEREGGNNGVIKMHHFYQFGEEKDLKVISYKVDIYISPSILMAL